MAIREVFYRSPHNYDVDVASDEATVGDTGPSLTVQSQSEDADINVMMKRFGVTGQMPANPRVPTFGDFSGVNDFQSAMNAINAAEDAFMEFTPEVRARFENNPQRVLEFMANDANRDEAVKLGLVNPKTAPKAPETISEAPVAPAPVVP